ncbi:UNVERIFIED_ORG: ATP-dependent DNA ligase [Rhizobium pisi]
MFERQDREARLSTIEGNELVYVGGVETGFNERSAGELRTQMDRLIISKSTVDTGRKRNAVFIEPKLVAEIEYRGWTHDGKLRHASYKGLRDAADQPTIYEID